MFATTRFYPVNQKDGVIYLDTKATKRDCAIAPGCTGMTGFELNQCFAQMQQQGYTVARLQPLKLGGKRTGAGRPKAPTKQTKTIVIDRGLHAELKARVAQLKQKLGRGYSLQDDISALVGCYDAGVHELAARCVENQGDNTTVSISVETVARLKQWQQEIRDLYGEEVPLGTLLKAVLDCSRTVGNEPT